MTSTQGKEKGQSRPMRDAAIDVVRRLVKEGYTAYFAGGCVRDRLLGITPKDYDIATDARPEQVAALFSNAQMVGMSFGVTLVPQGGHRFDVAAFRSDGQYEDHRHPSSIEYVGETEDASRRDFTINGLFEDPVAEKIIDHVGGQADLKARLIRAIGSAQDRFEEDHLRMLRAVRFQARFGFALEAKTERAITQLAPALSGISRERIGQEINLMLGHEGRAIAVAQLQRLGLDGPVLKDESRKGAPMRVSRMKPHTEAIIALAAWLLDRHEPGIDLSAQVHQYAEALMLSNADHRMLDSIITIHAALTSESDQPRAWDGLEMAQQKRLAVKLGFLSALAILQAVDSPGAMAIRARVDELERTGLQPEPFLNGTDLIGMGLEPSERTGQVLAEIYDAQLEQRVTDRDSALEMANRLI